MKKNLSTKKFKRTTQKQGLIILTISLLIALGYLVFRSTLSPAPLQVAEIGSSTGTVSLKLQANKSTLSPNETTEVKLTYSAGNTNLTAAQTDLSFDPTTIELSDLVVDPSFPTTIIAPTVENGKLSFALGVPIRADSGLTGNGTILTFTLKALKNSTPTLSFSETTLVTTRESEINSLQSVQNLTLNISDGIAATNSPSAIPSESPITSPSPSPSVSPSPSPSDLASTSPSPSPSVSPSPTVQKPASPTDLKYNCYGDGKRITLRWGAVANIDSYEVTFDQKDGDNDQTKTTTRPEADLEIKSNTPYNWQVVSLKNNVKSDATKVNDIKCSGDVAQNNNTSPSPSPANTPKPTPAPTKKPITQQVADIFKPKSPSPKPSIKSSPVPLASFAPSSPISSPGSLADVFASPTTLPTSTTTNTPNLLEKIFLGWQALFLRFVESFAN